MQLVQTILDQSHLLPIRPPEQFTGREYDHTLRLYPIPTAVRRRDLLLSHLTFISHTQLVLADQHKHYKYTYEGCHAFNPGPFIIGDGNASESRFYTYEPASGVSVEG